MQTIPVVKPTPSPERRDIARSYAAGANSYVVKPVDFDELIDGVSTTFDCCVVSHALQHLRKPMDLLSWLGANRSDTRRYREAEPGHPQSLRTVGAWRGAGPLAQRGLQGLQRRQGGKDAVLCAA